MSLGQVLRFDDRGNDHCFVEFETDHATVNVATCKYAEWQMVDLQPSDVQRLYDYLGKWLAARQNTGLGDK